VAWARPSEEPRLSRPEADLIAAVDEDAARVGGVAASEKK